MQRLRSGTAAFGSATAVAASMTSGDPHLSREPPFDLGETVRSPEGKGTVSAYSQLPTEWRVRVDLDRDRYWVGSSLVVSRADQSPRSKGSGNRKNAKRRKSGAS